MSETHRDIRERHWEESERRGARPCEHPGCFNRTYGYKAFCTDHFEGNDYAAKVIQELADREEEIERVKKRGWSQVNLNGSVAYDVLLALEQPKGLGAIQKCLLLESSLVKHYLEALQRGGLVKRFCCPRRKYRPIYRLLPEGEEVLDRRPG